MRAAHRPLRALRLVISAFPFSAFQRFSIKVHRFVRIVYLVVFVALAVGSGTFFWQTKVEYDRLKEVERITRERFLVAEQQLADQKEMLRRLEEDPAYVAMVIRRRLGYAKPDELIFRFEAQ
jgi:cell division protein DivIC